MHRSCHRGGSSVRVTECHRLRHQDPPEHGEIRPGREPSSRPHVSVRFLVGDALGCQTVSLGDLSVLFWQLLGVLPPFHNRK